MKNEVSPNRRILATIPLGNIVCDSYDGDTHIMVCDDSCRDCTLEKLEYSKKRIGEIWGESERMKVKKKMTKNEKA